MKAMVLETTQDIHGRPLQLRDLPDPEPRPGEALVRVRCCAICRTDLHVIEGDLPERTRPIICGHQAIGVVERLGPGCKLLKPGERVGIAWLRWTCGVCGYCRSGRENLCERSLYTGYDQNGGFTELAVVPEAYAYAIPEAFDDVHAAPLLCAGIIGYRALKRSNLPDGGTIALYGFGSSAHIVLQIARARGCVVYVVTRGVSHRRLAQSMGATWVGAEAREMPKRTNSGILFAPAGELVPGALAQLEKGGTLALAGISMSQIPPLDYQSALFYEKSLRSVTANTRNDGRELLAEAAAISLRPHVSTYPLEDANRALADLADDRIDGTGVLVL